MFSKSKSNQKPLIKLTLQRSFNSKPDVSGAYYSVLPRLANLGTYAKKKKTKIPKISKRSRSMNKNNFNPKAFKTNSSRNNKISTTVDNSNFKVAEVNSEEVDMNKPQTTEI